VITSNPSTWPGGDKVWDVCRAIAVAEGAQIQGSAPDRLNNPGDLSKGDEWGQPILGYVTLPDGEVSINFTSKEGGWQALYSKVSNITAGRSAVYSPQMTWRQIAQKYAGNSSAWVNNVARALGVSPDSRFADYFFSPDDTQGIEIEPGVFLLPPAEESPNLENGAPGQIPVYVWIIGGAVVLWSWLGD
jgi:hypothetical protein